MIDTPAVDTRPVDEAAVLKHVRRYFADTPGLDRVESVVGMGPTLVQVMTSLPPAARSMDRALALTLAFRMGVSAAAGVGGFTGVHVDIVGADGLVIASIDGDGDPQWFGPTS